MGKRGDAITSAVVLIALAAFAAAVVNGVMGMTEWSTTYSAAACFAMLLAIYLEVYSHRGR